MNRRLQEIKRKVMTFNQELREIDLEEHVDWLVEQAERVQELESDSYNAHLERLLDRKEQEIKRYREALIIISANLPLDGKEDYVYIARKALEGEE